MEKSPEIITVPPGAEINCGVHEDSDSVIAEIPKQLFIVGPRQNDAIPVRILGPDGPSDQVFYYHQRELISK